ncbi:hypothetical protein [uncultured Lactobacillus sp.]|nr:hypothetical protein [uncultured Lactobacillus sp.]
MTFFDYFKDLITNPFFAEICVVYLSYKFYKKHPKFINRFFE